MRAELEELHFDSWYELGVAWCELGGDLRSLHGVIDNRADAEEASLGYLHALNKGECIFLRRQAG